MVTGNGNRDNPKPSLNTIQDTTVSSVIDQQPNNACEKSEPWDSQMSKSEYEEIKDRVRAIETRISKEFTKLQSSLANTSMDSVDTNDRRNGPERVMEKFERTLQETEMMNTSPMTEQLAKHLSRGLKIRSSAENRVFRSPSARKIGSIRRKSQENVRLTRTKSWHLGSNLTSPLMSKSTRIAQKSPLKPIVTLNSPNVEKHIQIPRASLKRGRPNTFQNGLRSAQHPTDNTKQPGENLSNTFIVTNNVTEESKNIDMNADLKNEQWMCADAFFSACKTPNKNEENTNLNTSKSSAKASGTKVKPARKRLNMNFDVTPTNQPASTNTPRSANNVSMVDTMKTPMLPPRLPMVKKTPAKTPHALLANRNVFTPLWQQEQQQIAGRASIARLRSQNAGMVAAKAKLFDELVTEQPNARKVTQIAKVNPQHGVADSTDQEYKLDIAPSIRNRLNQASRPANNSPRRKGVNGVNRRQHLRAQRHTPIKKTPISFDKSLVMMSGNSSRMSRNSPSPAAIQSPMTRRMASSISATPHSKGATLITKPPRRIITPQNKRKPV